MISLIKQLLENAISLFQKIRCKFGCCNTTIDVRVVEIFKSPSNKSFYDKYQWSSSIMFKHACSPKCSMAFAL